MPSSPEDRCPGVPAPGRSREKPAFDPFGDRLARDIRNDLARALRDALLARNPAPLHAAMARWRSDPRNGAPHRAFLAECQARYTELLTEQVGDGPSACLAQAVQLWNRALFFECHELLETLWREAGGERRSALQGLILAAGAYVHRQAGHPRAASRLAARAAAKLRPFPHALPISGLDGLVAALTGDQAQAPPLRAESDGTGPSNLQAALSPKARRVQQALLDGGYRCQVMEMSQSTRTAEEAAAAVGCTVAQIVKSLVLRGKRSGNLVLVLASGAHRVDLKALARQISEPLGMADVEAVRQATGFAVGGVPPLGHLTRLSAYVDASLMPHTELWAAAGTPHALFRLTPQDLLAMTGGKVVEIADNALPD